jgi:rubrerythrin
VQRGGMMEDVKDPAMLLSMRFDTLEETVREAKRATFAYLQQKRHKDMPDQIDWRITDDSHLFPCPQCQQPLYQKAKLGRFGNALDLNDWGCPRCKKTVTLKTDDLMRCECEAAAGTPL